MFKFYLKTVLPFCLLVGCAAKPILPGSEIVMLSKELAPAGCRYVGGVSGTQGNFLTADFTSDANLVHGARNQLRNTANAMRANYVQIVTESLSHNTADGGLGGTYSAVVIGNAYICDNISGEDDLQFIEGNP